jgi:hypothetical protein
MHESPTAFKEMSVAEFNQKAEQTTRTLVGYVSFGADPSTILFSPGAPICPYMPIPQDTIESLRIGSSHPCFTSGQPSALMWDAQIVLKSQIEGGNSKHLTTLLVALAAYAAPDKHRGCECGSNASSRVPARQRHRPLTNYVATCTFYCSDGSSITTSGAGTSPADARTAAENNAVLQGCDVSDYGPCTITP